MSQQQPRSDFTMPMSEISQKYSPDAATKGLPWALTAIDQLVPADYTCLLFYMCPNWAKMKQMGFLNKVSRAFDMTLAYWPHLKYRVVTHPDGLKELRAPRPGGLGPQAPNTMPAKNEIIWNCIAYVSQSDVNFRDFLNSGAPPTPELERCCNRPSINAGWPIAPITLRISYYHDKMQKEVPDGLVLGFTFHDTVMDGPSIGLFLRRFALTFSYDNECKQLTLNGLRELGRDDYDVKLANAPAATAGPSVAPPKRMPSKLQKAPPAALQSSRNPASLLPEAAPAAIGKAPQSPNRGVILRIRHSHVCGIYELVRKQLPKDHSNPSLTNTMCGLLWVAVTQARGKARGAKDAFFKKSVFSTEVDPRSVVQREEYFGNLLMPIVATCSPDGLTHKIQKNLWALVAAASDKIQKAVDSVDEDLVANRLVLAERSKPYRIDGIDPDTAHARAVDTANTGLKFTDLARVLPEQGLDLGPIVGREQAVRKTFTKADPGSCLLLPKRGGTARAPENPAPWEFQLYLRRSEMDELVGAGRLIRDCVELDGLFEFIEVDA